MGYLGLPNVLNGSQVQITHVSLQNLDENPHRVSVMIQDVQTDSIVFWESHHAVGATYHEETNGIDVGGTAWKHPVNGRGDYVVHARIEQEDPSLGTERASARVGGTAECVDVTVEVDRQGSLAIPVGYHSDC